MTTIQKVCLIKTAKQYKVEIGNRGLKAVIMNIHKKYPRSKLAIISETHLKKIYQKKINSITNKNVVPYYFPSGEKSKQIKTKINIERFLFENHFNRQDVLIALGGGVVGDLVGYVASTYMRGIAYYQVPTSIVAMVDSSIGGKTGINNHYGKNLIGTFYQPNEVIIDLNFIDSLPEADYLNGLAEVIKYGCIYNPQIYRKIVNFPEKLKIRDKKYLSELIYQSVQVKNKVVSQDERENGLRKILNFGHTVGHAIEFLSNYRLKHGFAISIGMAIESYLSLKKKILSLEDFKLIITSLKNLGLPITLPEYIKSEMIYPVMKKDKKNVSTEVSLTIIETIGKISQNRGTYVHPIKEKEFLNMLKSFNDYIN